jgi:hypothetical protein
MTIEEAEGKVHKRLNKNNPDININLLSINRGM